jgi:hypothetical protein
VKKIRPIVVCICGKGLNLSNEEEFKLDYGDKITIDLCYYEILIPSNTCSFSNSYGSDCSTPVYLDNSFWDYYLFFVILFCGFIIFQNLLTKKKKIKKILK